MSRDRRELTDFEKAECAALKAEIAAFNAREHGSRRLTQDFLAQELGMTQGNLSSHLNGKRPINKEMAAKMALLLGIPVETFSPRLAKEIAAMVQAVQPANNTESMAAQTHQQPAGVNMTALQKLRGKATPRSLDVLNKIEKAALEGRLKEPDLIALEGIAARFEQLNTEKP
ncbi:helix-turn-helix domain-containing protein [Pseudomonas indica]|uniref:helix-turn-helix domain-containing protein n=1 Tax=Pseudomonas indica TaxID=137658 RepID=UPI003FD2C443